MTTTRFYRKENMRPLPWPLRSVAAILIVLQLILPVYPQMLLHAASVPGPATDDMHMTPPPAPKVTVNRTIPNLAPPDTELNFSSQPTDEEIVRARVFAGPIVSLGKSTATENADLAAALIQYRNRQDSDDAGAIENFLNAHPDSPRYLSLKLHLANHYRNTSQFTEALNAWRQIWAVGKNVADLNGRQIVDTAVGDWATFLVTMGWQAELKNLLSNLNGRDLQGAAAVRIADAANALCQMQSRPQKTFKCGPYSLSRISHALNPSAPYPKEVIQEESGTNGTSLYQNLLLAKRMGLDYQMAKRTAGAKIPLPSMVHWKENHFSALVSECNDRYRIEDPTFNQGWVSQKVLDAESDGYFLIPGGPLPPGWSAVTKQEAETVFGHSAPTQGDPGSPGPPPQCPNGMAQYSFGMMRISLNVSDIPLSYKPARGPQIAFRVTYCDRAVYPTGPFSYSNLGNEWGFGWITYISDDTTQVGADVKMVMDDGNYSTFTGYVASNSTYSVEEKTQGILTRSSGSSYQCLYPDGSMDVFAQPDATNGPRRVFLTQRKDPAGNAITLYYDSAYRLTNIVDAIGQVTTLSYGLTNDIYKITKITDPFSRYCSFQYNASGQLTNITDVIGVTSAFTYGAPYEADFINSLTTPYGTTYFTNNNADLGSFSSSTYNGRWIVATDPLGGQERAEFRTYAPWTSDGDPSNLVPAGLYQGYGFNSELNQRMSFFWNKKTMQAMNGQIDYTKARQYVFSRTLPNYYMLSGTEESVKQPLENARTWYDYPNQTSPTQEGSINKPTYIARVLDDGTTQAYQYQLNSIGRPTRIVDPANRTNLLTYATNNIDLLTVAQTVSGATNILAQYVYNAQHLPVATIDAAGQTNYFGYNTFGQLTSMTNALNETVFLSYDTNGYLLNIVAGSSADGSLSTNSFTYDGYGRVRTVTDPLGYTITTSYDAFDRPTNITYMDGTYERVVYNYLDPVLQRDRNGHWTAMTYDPLRHLTDTYDNLGRHTQYSWCSCGSLENIVDPNGNVTSWVRDLQNRVTQKIYADMTQINYAYETNNSRLLSVRDAKNQSTLYSYFTDNNLKQITYSNAVVATPSVSFTYDTNYNRMATMTDGTGTTTYNYYPITAGQLGAGKLSSVSNSFIGPTSVISYSYDALGRVTNRAINGVSQQVAFDHLSRVITVTNILGTFSNVYLGATALITTNFSPFGKKTIFSYYSITNDERLKEIWNQKTNGVTLSKFDYVYDAVGNITNWTQQADTNAPNVLVMQYDPVNQLLNSTTFSNSVAGAVLKQYAYGYDLSGNRKGEQISSGASGPVAVSQSSYNNANQMTSRSTSSGQMQFQGNLNEQGTVMVAGNAATMNHFTTNFIGSATVSSGTNVVPVMATDYSGNSRTNKYQVVVTNNGVAETISYDLNGNMTNVVATTFTNSYQWDAMNRLVQITGPTNQSLLAYDGFGRRVQIVEKTNGVAYITNKFIWDGQSLAEQRDLTGVTVVKRFFGPGEQISGMNYYFTRDHLGSVREMTDSTGIIKARYDYDPYGRVTKISGMLDSDFGYAEMYQHLPSGLDLALFRAYSTDLSRWLTKDPLGETIGLNLYSYVEQNPINGIDPLGLANQPPDPWHPPSGTQFACKSCDTCQELLTKIAIFEAMIVSHSVWDFTMPKPRGGNRHIDEIADLMQGYANCQSLYCAKCGVPPSLKMPQPDYTLPIPYYQPTYNRYARPFIPGITPQDEFGLFLVLLILGAAGTVVVLTT